MKRFISHQYVNGYRLRGVSDWLCYLTDTAGNWFYFVTECDPLWREIPYPLRRHSLGLDWDSTAQDEQEANECIAAIGLRRCQLGYKPTPVEPEDVAECLEHFGDKIRLVGAFQDGADFYAEIIGPDDEAISEHLTSYPHAVRGDYDMPGARRARELFARDYPQFCRVS